MTTNCLTCFFSFCLVFISWVSHGQDYYPDSLAKRGDLDRKDEGFVYLFDEYRRKAITVGILQGGGSLVGADFEWMFSDRWGLQVGAGLIGFGGAINYHFKENNIRSSFVSLQIWNQGVVGQSFVQRIMGPVYVYRSKKWFTASIGIGAVLDRGPAFPDNLDRTPVILLYSIGGYFLK